MSRALEIVLFSSPPLDSRAQLMKRQSEALNICEFKPNENAVFGLPMNILYLT